MVAAMNKKIWFGGAIAASIVIFALQNATVVDIDILFWRISLSKSLLVLLIFLAGVATGWLLPKWYAMKKGGAHGAWPGSTMGTDR